MLAQQNNSKLETIFFIVILMFGSFLRFYQIGSESIWYDESISVKLASSSIQDIVSGKAKDLGNPPLHNIFLHYWVKLFGSSEIVVRSLSAVFGVLTIILFYLFAIILFDKRTVLFATFLLSISPPHIYLSQEARTYTMLMFFCLASMFFMLKFLKKEKIIYLLLYSLATFLSLYSHYFTLFLILAQNIFLLIYWRRYKRLFWKWILGQGVIIVLFSLAWLPNFILQVTMKDNLSRSVQSWYKHLVFIPFYLGIGHTLIWKGEQLYKVALYSLLTFVAFIVPLLYGILKMRDRKETALFLGLWLLTPIAIPAIISVLVSPLFASRYAIFVLPPYYLFTAVGVLSIRVKQLKSACYFLIVLLCSLSLFNSYTKNVKFEWRQAGKFISENAQRSDLLLFDADIGESALSYYYKGDTTKFRLSSEADTQLHKIKGYRRAGAPIEDITDTVTRAGRIWLVLSNNYDQGAGDYYYRYLSDRSTEVLKKEYKGIIIYLFDNSRLAISLK